MDWTEELKLSIRKTATRKGRRSKSRDLLKDHTNATTSKPSGNVTQIDTTKHPELSIDITLGVRDESAHVSTNNNASSGSGLSDALILNLNSTTSTTTESKRPSFLRRISGGWADPNFGKTTKLKKGHLDNDHFGLKPSIDGVTTDDKSFVPNVENKHSDTLLRKKIPEDSVFEGPTASKLEQKIKFNITDVDLSILTKCLQQPADCMDETDVLWEWSKTFTGVMAEINADKPFVEKKKLVLKPDELPPPPSLMHN